MEFEKCLDKNGKYKTTKKNRKLFFDKVCEGDIEFLTKVLDCSPEMVDVIGDGARMHADKTPLMFAFQCAQAGVCSLLINRGADVHFTIPNGPSIIGWAATLAASNEGHDPEFVQILERVLEMGADPTVCDHNGEDPLANAIGQYTAANSEHYQTAILLLEAGADPKRKYREWLLRLVRDYHYLDINDEPATRSSNLAPEIFRWYGISEDEIEAARKNNEPPPEPPFLSHPDGVHQKAMEAIADAMEQLDQLGDSERWMRFDAQGRGDSDEQYVCECVLYRNGVLDVEINESEFLQLLKASRISAEKVKINEAGQLVIASLTPLQRAKLLEKIFLQHFGIVKTKRGNDYGLSVEWA